MEKDKLQKLEIAAAFVVFLLYGYLCLHFYLERSTMSDYAFQLFKMIQTCALKTFQIELLSTTSQKNELERIRPFCPIKYKLITIYLG